MEEVGQLVNIIDTSQSGQEPVTSSMAEVVPFVLQQNHEQEDAVEDTADVGSNTAGSYQIVAQQLLPTGQVQLTLSDGVNFLQTVINADQLQGFEAGQQSILLQAADVDPGGEISYVAAEVPDQTSPITTTKQEEITPAAVSAQLSNGVMLSDNTEPVVQNGLYVSGSQSVLHVLHQSPASTSQLIAAAGTPNQYYVLKDESDAPGHVMEESGVVQTQQVKQLMVNTTQHSQYKDELGSTEMGNTDIVEPSENTPTSVVSMASEEPVVEKKPDLSRPIEVTDHMEVTVNGKKCLLKVNPDTGQLCAYPLISSGRRRGRPKKSERKSQPPVDESDDSQMEMKPKVKIQRVADYTSSAAQSLLELSNTGPDGIRRSARNRGKPKTLEEYEVLELSSDDDAAIDVDDEVLPNGAVRRRKVAPQKDYIPPSHITPSSEKRGRGRPRRYPRADDNPGSNTIPTVMIPSEDGTTIMMAPIQGITNLEAFQEQVKSLSIFQQVGDEEGLQYLNLTGSVMDVGDGNTLNIQLGDNPIVEGQVTESQCNTMDTVANDQSSVAMDENQLIATETSGQLKGSVSDSPLPGVLSDSQSWTTLAENQLEPTAESQTIVQESPQDGACDLKVEHTEDHSLDEEDASEETKPLEDTVAVPEVKHVKVEIQKVSAFKVAPDKSKMILPAEGKPTIIQIPENLLPMFTQKKEPIRIGLKASEVSLEKMKCPQCDYQGYYEQQYQEHVATHDNALRCKCCKYATFVKDDLITHFKKNHPRCICNYCDHMAEHAYIIKRHTMRHTQIGCKCDVCGKVYKDSYVLKMHVKMVHMPAEVLFECNVCCKKFTRKAHLKRHLRIHEPEKPHKCPYCNYRGCEKSDIAKHLLVHEDPKHQCPICNKSFRHIKNKDLHLKRHSGQRDYKCGVCDFYGYTFTDIRKHIERKHTDCRPFICDRCTAVFTSEQAYKEHKAQSCDVFMIEQALAVATSDGGTTQAMIQIPSNFTLDGSYPVEVDGAVSVSGDKDRFAVHAVGLQGGLSEDQIQMVDDGQMSESELQSLVAQGQLSETELQAAVSQGQLSESELQAAVSQGQLSESELQAAVSHNQMSGTTPNLDYTVSTIQTMCNTDSASIQGDRSDLELYKSESEDSAAVSVAVQMYDAGEEAEEDEETMDENGMREQQMDSIMSDSDDKSAIDNDQMLEMVTIIR